MNNDPRLAFAARVKAWRERRGLSQSKAARAMGVNLDTLQNWEIARNMPRGIGLAAIENIIKPKPLPRSVARLLDGRAHERNARTNATRANARAGGGVA
jgi:transcriptional regulator with XRE-family HTH domain